MSGVAINARFFGRKLNSAGKEDLRRSVDQVYSRSSEDFVDAHFLEKAGHKAYAKTLMDAWESKLLNVLEDIALSEDAKLAAIEKAYNDVVKQFELQR